MSTSAFSNAITPSQWADLRRRVIVLAQNRVLTPQLRSAFGEEGEVAAKAVIDELVAMHVLELDTRVWRYTLNHAAFEAMEVYERTMLKRYLALYGVILD